MQLSMKKIKSKDPRKFYPRCVKSLLVFDSLTLKTLNQCQCDMSISTNSKLLMHFTTHSAQHSFFTIGGTSGLRFGLSHSESVHPSFQPVGCSTHLVGTSAGFLLSGWIGSVSIPSFSRTESSVLCRFDWPICKLVLALKPRQEMGFPTECRFLTFESGRLVRRVALAGHPFYPPE